MIQWYECRLTVMNKVHVCIVCSFQCKNAKVYCEKVIQDKAVNQDEWMNEWVNINKSTV